MKQRILEHCIGIIFVTIVMVAAMFTIEGRTAFTKNEQQQKLATFTALPVTSINDPFERALLADCMDLFFPGQHDSNKVILAQVYNHHEAAFNQSLRSSALSKGFSFATFRSIFAMYVGFCIIYSIVMALTYYGVQTLGTLRFVLRQQSLHRKIMHGSNGFSASTILLAIAKIAAYTVLFSPAYVIAYSIRTEFNTDTSFFMIILAVISNGLLVMYTNKFYTFLVAESRKGYVENGLVKNLRSDYSLSHNGIAIKTVFALKKRFPGHIFNHIFKNARFQYLSTIKEQASFLITGLVIIEMALNIHGHLTYEMLRQLLYKNYTSVLVIMLFIFYTVKLTELFTDILIHRESQRYENR